ncbi:type I glyceraldehyde-3-phosphate dehydrogenase [archaeon]|jgi:glyceraldehyde 3-phosphate dehydrogenase|nr:type I glyceraldehyde-3-phosphate dehydrogenase [archaeon]MBT6606689.1 type I glyceraldehyde-3-phosphate dehydrogenase [archaeon]MBT7251932.1 type I glyceraldehyde-3-phosphate dehydrogenase [archaeon]MBT7660611.1 type I glyceraldehyde-3-phosphate dehydrogenase [archaeon]
MRIAVNGFGRIGRIVTRILLEGGYDVVAVNDVHGVKDARYLLTYDSIYGKLNKKVEISGNNLVVDGKEILVLKKRNPATLPWKKLRVDVVVEATGMFTDPKKACAHQKAGATKVIITAPCSGSKPDLTIVPGVNGSKLKKSHKIISVASCTTNCLAPVVKVLEENFGVVQTTFTTIHAYTNDQDLLDSSKTKVRRGRSAAQNIIPTTTGASNSIQVIFPKLRGKIIGRSVRVPVDVGSLIDLTAQLKKPFTVASVNKAFNDASQKQLRGILEYSTDELVSSDVIRNSHSSVFDSLKTEKIGKSVRILSWYDNEFGYSSRVVDVIGMIERLEGGA